MKKLVFCMVMFCGFAMAQTSTDTSSATSQGTTSTTTHKHGAKADKMAMSDAKEKTVKGCLHKDGENVWLQTHTGKYHVMSKEDVTAHDGHEVKVTGTTTEGPAPNDPNKKVKHLEASKVEMVSDKCSMGTKKMKMSDEEMSKKGATKKQ